MLIAYNCAAIALVTDLESRPITHRQFIKSLTEKIDQELFDIPIFASAPDKMIENWYLADISKLSKRKVYLKDNLKQKPYEGKDGKKELKKLLTKKCTYNEITHGAELFKLIRVSQARANSKSFDQFMEKFKEHR